MADETVKFGFKRYVDIGPLKVEWVGSWGARGYGRFGWWRHSRGFTVRYRAWLLLWATNPSA